MELMIKYVTQDTVSANRQDANFRVSCEPLHVYDTEEQSKKRAPHAFGPNLTRSSVKSTIV